MVELRCLDCGAALEPVHLDARPALACSACGRRHPLVGDRVPLLVREPQAYLARLYLQHAHYLRRQAQRADDLERRADETPDRADSLRRLAAGLRSNAALIDQARRELAPLLALDDLVDALHDPEFIGYGSTLEYLERDWCGLEAGERELALILGELDLAFAAGDSPEPADSDSDSDLGALLVLGAGAGRVAWELRRRCRQVVAVDASLTMAQHFYALLDGPGALDFHAISTASMDTDADMVVPRQARGPAERGDRRDRERLHYLVADAAHLPLADHSQDAVVSVYFTDVLPLRVSLAEVVRVLRPGGRFIHFGPLEYHFDDLGDHLSAEQVRRTLSAAGFCIEHDRRLASEHLPRAGSMARRRYDNWSLAARLRHDALEVDADRPSAATRLRVAGSIEYRAAGRYDAQGHTRGAVELLVGDACYRVGPPVLDILAACVDGATAGVVVERVLAVQPELGAEGAWRLIEQLRRVGALTMHEPSGER